MASVRIILDTRRPKKDKTYPVMLRVIKNGKSTSVSLGIHVPERDWDDRKRQVRKSHPNAQLLNQKILEEYTRLGATLLRAEEQDTVCTAIKPVRAKESYVKPPSFFEYGFTWVERLNKSGRVGNARAYENTLKRLSSYLGHNRLSFDDINFEFLEDFQANMLGKGVRQNTISFYLRTVRTIYNKAIKARIVNRQQYPFDDFAIKHEATAKRAVGKEQIQMNGHGFKVCKAN
jgi:hypothetical protein